MKGSLKERILAIVKSRASNHEIALGIAVGVFISFSPLYGIQMLICLLIVLIFKRLNKLAVFFGVQLSWIYPVMLYFDYVVGRFLVPGKYPTLSIEYFRKSSVKMWVMVKQFFHAIFTWSFANLNGDEYRRLWALIKRLFPAMLVGSLVVGGAAALLAYLMVMMMMKKYRNKEGKMNHTYLKVFLVLFTLHASFVCWAGEEKQEVTSTVAAVTVYEDRALMKREAVLELQTGEREVIFVRLPAMLVDDSLRATGSGTARVTIVGLEVEREYLGEAKDERVRAIEEEIERMGEENRSLEDRADAVELQMKFLESIKSSVGDGISREMLMRAPEPEQWKRVVSFLGEEYDLVTPKLREVQKKRRDLKKKMDAAKKRLKQVISAMPREQKNVCVTLDVSHSGSFNLELFYIVQGASWRPCYDARGDSEKGSVELVYCGQVRQNTGEDWKDVELELSTARPSIGGRPPELRPWYITFRRYRPLGEKADKKRALFLAGGDLQQEEIAPAAPAEGLGMAVAKARHATAEIGQRGEAVTFRVKKKQTIPSDNSLHKTVIAPFTMKAAYDYFSVPKISEYAYLRAKVTNGAGCPLLGGRVSVFLGPEYVGSSSIEYVAPGEEFDLYLGIDEGMKVERKLLTAEAERSMLRRRTGWKNFRYRIEVENNKKRKEKIIVMDQIPVSREPDIKVTLEDIKPKPVTIEKREEPGSLTWRIELDPGEKKTIEYEFSVSYPKDREIEGLK